MISLCDMLIQKKSIIISSITEILHINVIQCQLILMKHFEFVFKNAYLDLFNFESGILHLYHSMALLHLSNQFMYHMTISGNC